MEDTQKIAREWLSNLPGQTNKEQKEATLIGLSGHLGAGKTAFVKAVAKELGVKEEVTSPTFVIMKVYDVRHRTNLADWERLVHIDAYRLEKPEEFDILKIDELMANPANLIMVEWPEQVALENFGEFQRLRFEMRDGVCVIIEECPQNPKG